MAATRIRVTVAHRPPFVFVGNNSGQVYYSGLLVDLLNKVLATSNERIAYDMYVSPSNAGGTFSGGRWTGVIGELVEGRANVTLFPLTRTAARLKAIDCTYSYLDSGLGLLVRDEMTGPGPLSVLAPFATTLWITLLCTVIGIALLFWALDAYGRWIRHKQTEALRLAGTVTERQIAQAKKDDRNPMLISFMAAAGAPERPGRATWGVQVLYVVYCFFCLIVLSAYTANLTSYLAVRRADVGIAGLQDVARANGFIGVNPNGSTAAYFASSQDTRATQMQPFVRYCASDVCVQWLRTGYILAFVSDLPALQYMAVQQPCDLTTVGDPFGPGNLVLGLPKNSSLTQLFNNAIQTFAEDGTLTSLRRAWFDGLSQCKDTQSILDNTRLSISQMLGAFVFLLAGVLVAFITGTVENLKWCLARAYARSYSEPDVQGNRTLSRLRTATWRRLSMFASVHQDREDNDGGAGSSTPPGRAVIRPPVQQSPFTAGTAAADAAGAGAPGTVVVPLSSSPSDPLAVPSPPAKHGYSPPAASTSSSSVMGRPGSSPAATEVQSFATVVSMAVEAGKQPAAGPAVLLPPPPGGGLANNPADGSSTGSAVKDPPVLPVMRTATATATSGMAGVHRVGSGPSKQELGPAGAAGVPVLGSLSASSAKRMPLPSALRRTQQAAGTSVSRSSSYNGLYPGVGAVATVEVGGGPTLSHYQTQHAQQQQTLQPQPPSAVAEAVMVWKRETEGGAGAGGGKSSREGVEEGREEGEAERDISVLGSTGRRWASCRRDARGRTPPGSLANSSTEPESPAGTSRNGSMLQR